MIFLLQDKKQFSGLMYCLFMFLYLSFKIRNQVTDFRELLYEFCFNGAHEKFPDL
jgi:hypothetical protein